MRRTRHLLLATVEDAYDVRSWSGIPFALRVALEAHVDQLTVFRPSPPKRNAKDAALRVILGGKPPRWPLWMTNATLRQNARELQAATHSSGAAATLAISSQCIAKLDPFPTPTYLFSDSPWLAWMQAYERYDSLPLRGNAFARLEAAAARRCNGLFFGSDWALQEAERLYFDGHATNEQRARLHRAELGTNWRPELDTEALQGYVHARARDRLDLLFVGRDWERKGGPLAVQVTESLRQRGVRACLHVVGCRPAIAGSHFEGDSPAVRLYGPLYRDDPTQSEQLRELFLRCHLMLVPTEAECFGIGFAEAQAFGLPPVSRAVHALPSVVLDGVTGLLLPPDAPPDRYAERMQELMSDWSHYENMALQGVVRAQTLLDWNATAARITDVIFGDSNAGAS